MLRRAITFATARVTFPRVVRTSAKAAVTGSRGVAIATKSMGAAAKAVSSVASVGTVKGAQVSVAIATKSGGMIVRAAKAVSSITSLGAAKGAQMSAAIATKSGSVAAKIVSSLVSSVASLGAAKGVQVSAAIATKGLGHKVAILLVRVGPPASRLALVVAAYAAEEAARKWVPKMLVARAPMAELPEPAGRWLFAIGPVVPVASSPLLTSTVLALLVLALAFVTVLGLKDRLLGCSSAPTLLEPVMPRDRITTEQTSREHAAVRDRVAMEHDSREHAVVEPMRRRIRGARANDEQQGEQEVSEKKVRTVHEMTKEFEHRASPTLKRDTPSSPEPAAAKAAADKAAAEVKAAAAAEAKAAAKAKAAAEVEAKAAAEVEAKAAAEVKANAAAEAEAEAGAAAGAEAKAAAEAKAKAAAEVKANAAEANATAEAEAKAAAEVEANAAAEAEAKAAAEAQATQALQRAREAKAAQEAADKAAADRVEANRLFAVQQAAEAAEAAERAAAAGAECELFCVNIPLPVHGGEKFVWTVDDRLMQFVAPEGMLAGQEHEYELTAHQLAAAPKLEKFGLVIPLPVPGGQSFVWTVDDKLMEFQAPPGMAVGEEYEFEFTELELLSAPSVNAPLEITPPDEDDSPSDGAKATQNPSKRSVWKVIGKKGKEGTPKASRTVRTATSPYDPELDPDNKRGSTRRQLSFARRVASGFRL